MAETDLALLRPNRSLGDKLGWTKPLARGLAGLEEGPWPKACVHPILGEGSVVVVCKMVVLNCEAEPRAYQTSEMYRERTQSY